MPEREPVDEDLLTNHANQAQLKAEQSLAQNKGVDSGKSGILSNNSSNGEQKHTIVRGKMPEREPVDEQSIN